jgi:uncharacterized repeat protein (TIGR01451 family)
VNSTRTLFAAILLPLLLAFSVKSAAQSYVYVNNQSLANSISGYSVSSAGVLTPVPGSPYLTAGIGSTTTCQGLDRIITNAAKNLLFVSNSGDQTISAFQINPASGGLTAVAGSPFASGLMLDHCGGISLAATPDGNFLLASSNGQIKTFAVDANGILTPGAVTANCCSPTVGMKISANGQLLALANETSVSVYTINADGSLTAATGSPFARTGTGLLTAVDFSCAADRLYGSESSFASSTITDAWTIGTGGVLSAVVGSPFLGAGTDSTSLVLTPDNSRLFTNDLFSNKIDSFAVHADGSLEKVGSFGGTTAVHVPGGLATDAAGTLLFAADDTFGVAVFSITGTGALTSVSDLAINRAGVIQGLAAYPPRSCTAGDFGVSVTADAATADAGSNVTYSITIANNGSTAASANIIDTLPAGETFVSCKATGGGVCSLKLPNPHVISFSSITAGASQTVTLVAQTDANLTNGTTLTNAVALGTKSIIDTNNANDSATVDVTVTAQPGPTILSMSPSSASYGGLAILTATLQKKSNGALLSGKAVSFSINGTAVGTAVTNTIGQAILTASISGLGLGSYPGAITASFAGDSVFNPSAGAGDLTVNKAVLTVIGSNAVRLYGDRNPAFTYVISGFMNSDTIAVVSGTTTCSSATDVTTSVGRYPVSCQLGTLSAANYTFTLFPGSLTINPVPLVVTADNATRIYGDPNPAFTGSISGLRNGDVITPNFFSNASASSPVGTYPILAAYSDPAGKLLNYTPVVTGTLTITQAQLTVTPDNQSRLYGDPNPVLTGVLSGIRNGDKITALYSTTAVQTSPIGTYPITATLVDPGSRLPNYNVTVNSGTLTINPAPLTVTAADASRLYGDPNSVFTGTIVGIKNADAVTATYSSSADATSPVGTYPIIPAVVDPAGKLANYTLTVINGVLTINPAPLSVTANNASRVYGNANPVFAGTTTGLKNLDPITPNFVTTATISSPVGPYPITFDSFNDPAGKLGNYTVISVKAATLTVTKAQLSVTGFNGSRIYGDANPAPTVTGLKLNDPITFGYSNTSATQSSPIGTYSMVPVIVSDAQNKLPNYTLTLANGTMTINQAQFTVTANSASRAYGSPNPVFTGTLSNSNTVTPITTVLANDGISYGFSTTATQTSNAGTFSITISASDPNRKLSNYKVLQANGTLTVTQVSLTVAENSQTVPLGATTWACSSATSPSAATPSCVSYNGLVQNGVVNDGPAKLGGNVSCTLSNGTGNVGTFSNGITCSGLTSPNYTFTFVKANYNVQYEPAGFACTNGPGHVILSPIAASGSSLFTKVTTPTIAVQFRVCDAKGNSISASGVVSSFVLTSVNGVPANTPAPQGGPFAFVGGTLANGAGSAGWQFNLSTSNLSGGNTYAYRINLNDGTTIGFQFSMN